MHIDPRKLNSIYPAQRAGAPRPVGHPGVDGKEPAPARSQVQVSERARLLQAARAALEQAAAPAQRQQRLAALEEAVQSGDYAVAPEALAGRLWRSGALRW